MHTPHMGMHHITHLQHICRVHMRCMRDICDAFICVISISPRLIGSPKLQIIFHKRATEYRALLRKMTYWDKGSYEYRFHHIWETMHLEASCGVVDVSCVAFLWVLCVTCEAHSYECYASYERYAWYMRNDASRCVAWCCRCVMCRIHMSAMHRMRRIHISDLHHMSDTRDIYEMRNRCI